MNKLDKINVMIHSLKNDYDNGSRLIAINALKMLKYSISEFHSDLFQIELIADKILKAKPSMAAVKNIITTAISKLKMIDTPYDSKELYNKILSMISKAENITIGNAQNKLFCCNNTIITCSYSSTVMSFFQKAARSGFDFRVFAMESLWKGKSYGEKIYEDCRKLNINVSVIKDNDINDYMSDTDFAVIGADCILNDGSIVNGIPSITLSRAMYESKKRLFVIAESFKQSDKIILEDGFEFIDKKFISEIFSDNVFN